MIAVVYSGSRYATWKLASKGMEVANFKTFGINPFFHDEKYILQMLNKHTELINNAEQIKKIYFFGAGASSLERNLVVSNALAKFFRFSKVFVNHDLLAAAKASCDDKPGIVCILGSGSNAAYFDGRKIVENNFGLGYVIGDEGSANWQGKMLLKNYLSGNIPDIVKNAFNKKYDLDRKQILDKVYRQPHPNVFLSSFSDFFKEHRDKIYIKKLITEGFNDFIATYLEPLLNDYKKDTPVYFVGTVAANFQDYLRETADKKNIIINSVIKEPIYNLLNYYANKN